MICTNRAFFQNRVRLKAALFLGAISEFGSDLCMRFANEWGS